MLTQSPAPSPALPTEVEPPRPGRSPLLTWLPLALLAFVVAKLAARASAPVTDPDTWWHLRLGEEFQGQWSLADPGQLSPFATRPWFATQWTLELVASRIEGAFGLAGVSWLAAVGVVLLSAALYVSCRSRSAVIPAVFATAIALLASSGSQGPRPQVASFILLAVFTAVWLRTMDDLKPRWWLIPLSWLWACTHGMWFIGTLVGLAVVAGLLLDGRLSRRTTLHLGLVPIGGFVAAGMTPVGPKLLMAPLATSKMAEFVTEWQPPKFTEFQPAVAALMIAIVVATWARGGSRRSWVEILLLAMATGWIVLSYRTIAVGAVIAAPLLAISIQSWISTNRQVGPKFEKAGGVAVALAILVGLAIAAPSRGTAPLEELGRMNDALDRLPSGTVVLNDYALGGWLEWRHRNIAPVVDGMTDAYHVSWVGSYTDASRLKPGWHDFVDETGAQYALLESGTPLSFALARGEHWDTVVRESKYVLLRRPSAGQQ